MRVNILVWHGNVYIPTLAHSEYGGWIKVEPVIITKPVLEKMLPAIKESLANNLNQSVVKVTEDKGRKDPVLDINKAKSWNKIAETGASYSIVWQDDLIRVSMTMEGKKNKFHLTPKEQENFHQTQN